MRRLVVGGVSAVTLAGVGVVGLSASASATPSFSIKTLAGPNRFATAAAIAEAAYPSGANTVILAGGLDANISDSLSASYLAGQLNGGMGAPILLTNPNALPAATTAALTTLKAKDVIIVGGSASVSDAVQTTLSATYTVSRISGPNRFATSEALDTNSGDTTVGSAGGGTSGAAPMATSNGVTLSSSTVAQGGTVSGTLADPSGVTSLTVTVPGSTTQTLTVNATTGAFSFTVPSTTSAGTYALIFTATPTSGTPTTGTADLTVTTATGSSVSGQKFAIVADGADANLVDSLGASPVSFADHFPLFLVNGDTGTLSAAQLALLTSEGIQNVLLVGGSSALGTALTTQITTNGQTPISVAGADRSATSEALAEYAINNLGFSTTTFDIASGNQGNLVDSLSGGPYGGVQSAPAPTLITDSDTDVGSVGDFATMYSGTETSATVFGGTAAVAASALATITADGQAAAGPGSVSVSSTSVPVGGTVSGTVSTPGEVSSITVSGCGLASAPVTFSSSTGAFSVTIPSTQAAGNCTLTFMAKLASGTTVTSNVGVTVTSTTPPPPTPSPANGLGTPPSLSAAPVLDSASIVSNGFTSGTTSTVEYTFSGPVTTETRTDFKLEPYDTTTVGVEPTTVNPDPSNTDAVLAQFPATVDPASYTIAVVDNTGTAAADGAVSGASGASFGEPNPLGSVPFTTPGTTSTGQTTAPDLVSATIVTSSPGEDEVQYTFDKPVASVTNMAGFGYYTSTGAPGTPSTSASVIPGTDTVTATFAATASSAVRFYVLHDAVQGEVAGTGGENPIGSYGAATPPDLASVTPVSGAPTEYDFTFDNSSGGTAEAATDYHLFLNDAVEVSGTGTADAISTNEVQVTFGTLTSSETGDVTLAAVNEGAFTVTSTGSGNTVGAVPITGTNESGGLTDGPDLQSAAVTTSGGDQVTYTFNQPILSSGFVAGSFFVIGNSGSATFGTALSVTGDTVTVTFTAASVATAKGAGVTGAFDAEDGHAAVGVIGTNLNPNAPGDVTLPS